jgi:FkbM family methyltransferase
MSDNGKNIERTKAYLKAFNREKTLKLLINNDKPVIMDVGANVGDSITEFLEWWPKAKIHAFEPQKECWPFLDTIAQEFDDVHVNRFALGSEDADEAAFFTHDLTSGQSGFSKINVESRDSINLSNLREESPQKIKEYASTLNHQRNVGMCRAESYIRDHKIIDIDLLKLDTQGYEPEVLKGMGASLSYVSVVITELMFYDFYERSLSFSDIEQYLLPAGFRLYDISHISKNPMNGRTDWIDAIYVNVRKQTGK